MKVNLRWWLEKCTCCLGAKITWEVVCRPVCSERPNTRICGVCLYCGVPLHLWNGSWRHSKKIASSEKCIGWTIWLQIDGGTCLAWGLFSITTWGFSPSVNLNVIFRTNMILDAMTVMMQMTISVDSWWWRWRWRWWWWWWWNLLRYVLFRFCSFPLKIWSGRGKPLGISRTTWFADTWHLKDLIHCIFEEAMVPRSNVFHYPWIIRHPKTHLSDITLGGSRSAPRQVEIPNSDLERECESPSKTWTVRAFAFPFSTRPTLLTLVPLKTSPCHPIMFKVVLSFPARIGCDLWVFKMARPAPDIISRPLFTGRMFFIKKTGLSWLIFMWEKLLCFPWGQ